MQLTDFDLYPRDYLRYAERLLGDDLVESRLACVGHLKRAVDCQVELFLACLGLRQHFARRRLGFDKKMAFIKAIGIVSPRSLSRLNEIRNQIEHEYADPKNVDLDMYFDLCQCFVSLLEGHVFFIYSSAEVDFYIGTGMDDREGWFSCKFDANESAVIASFQGETEVRFDFSNIDDFASALRCLFALISLAYIGDEEDCRLRLEAVANPPNKPLQVTPTAVTPTASAPGAPSAGVPEL